MSTSTLQPPEASAPQSAAVAKLLDRARGLNIRPDPDDAATTVPAAKPMIRAVQRDVEVPRDVSARSVPATEEQGGSQSEPPSDRTNAANAQKKDNRPRRKAENGRTVNRTFDIVTGTATQALTVRVPEEVHARLVLVATTNRLSRNGQPATLNELIAEGIEHVLTRYDAA
jgi:hypothetical protein